MSQLRKDPITGRWVAFHPERVRKAVEIVTLSSSRPTGHSCYYCEGRETETPPEIFAIRQAGTHPNATGWTTRVVPHPVPSLRVETVLDREGLGMFDRMSGVGAHEVVVECPDHDSTLVSLDGQALENVFLTYRDRIADLKRDQRLRYISVFKERGIGRRVSTGHSISEILGLPVTPLGVKAELIQCRQYFAYKQRCVFCDMIRDEQRMNERIVFQNDKFIVFEPFAARYPFETWVLPKQHQSDMVSLDSGEGVRQLAEAMRTALFLIREALLDPPYGFVLHTMPNTVPRPDYWESIDQDYHWHFEIVPRVRESSGLDCASGFFVNPVLPEEAADFLQETRQRSATC